MNRVFVVSARRTSISPRHGALADLSHFALASQAADAVLADAGLERCQVDGFFLGNALAAGGNPARAAALASGVCQTVPAWSIDTQCCSGLDAISMAVDRIRAGSAHVLLAGGAESASQAPIRTRRGQTSARSEPRTTHQPPFRPYEEASFTPWPSLEPSMVGSALSLSGQLADLPAEYAWAVRSHERALAADHPERLSGPSDTFTRRLNRRACEKSASHSVHNPTTMAPLADGAAMVVLLSESALMDWLDARGGALSRNGEPGKRLLGNKSEAMATSAPRVSEVLSSIQVGANPFAPGLATNELAGWLNRLKAEHDVPGQIELMESFAAQVLLNIKALELEVDRVNVNGGLLAMGHPIGASGAVLLARLHHALEPNVWGVALIPAAGGVASGLALRGIGL